VCYQKLHLTFSSQFPTHQYKYTHPLNYSLHIPKLQFNSDSKIHCFTFHQRRLEKSVGKNEEWEWWEQADEDHGIADKSVGESEGHVRAEHNQLRPAHELLRRSYGRCWKVRPEPQRGGLVGQVRG